MCHNFTYSVFKATASNKHQQGSSLVIAIFILVVMMLLGAALTRVLSTGSEAVAFEVVGTRAFQAANIGVQHRLALIFPLTGDSFHCSGENIVTSGASHSTNDPTVPAILANLSSVNGLQNCRVEQMSCEDFKVDGVVYYQITSEGQCDIGGEVTSRTVEVEARSL